MISTVAGCEGLRLPVTAAQAAIWTDQALHPDSPVYQLGLCVDIDAVLDPSILRRAIELAVQDAQALRTAVVDDDGLHQILVDDVPAPLTEIDVADRCDPWAAALRWMDDDLRTPPRLDRAGHFRHALIRLAPDRSLLYLRHHHIHLDGVGHSRYLARVAEIYTALDAGVEAGPSSFRSLADLVAEDGEYQASVERGADRAHWTAVCDDLNVIPVGGRTADAAPRPLRHDVTLGPAQVSALVESARWPVLLAATGLVYQHRVTSAADVVIGMAVAARTTEVARTTPATLGNEVPLRVHIGPEQSVGELLRRTGECLDAALGAQRYRHDDMRRDLDRAGESGTLFGLAVNALGSGCEYVFGGARGRRHMVELGPVPDLAVNAFGRPDLGVTLHFRANPRLWSGADLAAHARRFVDVLTQLAGPPDRPLGRLDLLGPDERAVRLAAATEPVSGVADEPAPDPVALIQNRVAAAPDAPALRGPEPLTYAELDARANRLARLLADDGVRPGDLVGIALPHGADLITGLLAILKAGAGYLPLDPAHPVERSAGITDAAQPALLLTGRDHPLAALTDVPVRCPDELAARLPAYPAAPPQITVPPDSVAYVIFTSGSTGRPKGVVISRANVSHFLVAMQRRLGLRPDDAVLAMTTMTFDISVLEQILPLTCGASVVPATRAQVLDPPALRTFIRREGITVAQATPSLWHAIVGDGATELAGVRVLTGGEALPADLAERLVESSAEVLNVYGPTEGTVWSTVEAVDGPDPGLGRPIGQVGTYVLDPALQPVPEGQSGELYLSGPPVALGYLGQAALTAERFVADPFGPGRLYRTGDLVRVDPGGALRYLGRADHQVKINGFRIELGEVESALAAVPGVDRAVVLARDDDGLGRRLVAYVVPATGARIDHADLCGQVSRVVPAYMVPAATVVLAEFPRNTAGKVDRSALPAPVREAVSSRGPRDERDETLCALFARATAVADAGIDDDFFRLGGDSLGCLRLVGWARERGLHLSTDDMFRHRTVAAIVDSGAVVAVAGGVAEIRPSPLPAPLPAAELAELRRAEPGIGDVVGLTPVQQGLVFHEINEAAGAGVYTVQAVLGIDGPLQPELLRRCADELMRRHTGLRAAFRHTGLTRPVQTVAAELPADWRETEPCEPGGVAPVAAAERARGFALDDPPLVRFVLVPHGPDRYSLVITCHHIVLDGWSLPVLVRELLMLHDHGGDVAALPVPPSHLEHLAWLGKRDDERAAAAWRGHLDGIDGPTRITSPGVVATAPPEYIDLSLGEAQSARLNELARAHGVTLHTVVQAAWALVLGRVTGRDDVVFGTSVAGRPAELEGAADMVGMFLNTVPLRARLRPGDRVTDLLAELHDAQAELLEHQHLGLTEIHRAAGREELFDTVAVFENQPRTEDPGGVDGGLRLSGADMWGPNHYPLSLYTLPGIDVTLRVNHRPDVVDVASARRFGEWTRRVLADMAADPARPLGRIEPLTSDQLAAACAGPQLDLPGCGVAVMVRDAARRHPDGTAVISGDTALTYRELIQRVDRLAAHLRSRGAGPERFVALALPRTAALPTALLAVLQAGAAYLPLDPSHPAERTRHILQDASPDLVLATSAVAAVLPQHDVPVVLVDDDGRVDPSEAPGIPAPTGDVPADRPVYALYTSGSTGRPKGVVVGSLAFENLLRDMTGRIRLEHGDRLLALTTVGFDIAGLELLGPLVRGAGVVLGDSSLVHDPAGLRAAIAAHDVTVMQATPSLWRSVLADGRGLPECVRVLVGGEALPSDVAEGLVAGGREVINVYGPTETTVWSTAEVLDADGPVPPPVGAAISNTTVQVLDPALRPVPEGVPGEVYLGGHGLARGYLHRPGTTAARFVPDPAGPAGARMYRTGDIGTRDRDGTLHYVGRADDQVKLRGHRIELGEVEAVLAGHGSVRRAAAVIREDRPGVQQLVAYLVAAPESGPPGEESIRGHAAGVLPPVMVPSAFVTVDALPLNPNGKLDRTALPAPDSVPREVGRAPRNPVEELLCALFTEVLGCGPVGIDDGFFELGGDSIASISLVGRARAAGLVLGGRDVFDPHATVAVLAQVAVPVEQAARRVTGADVRAPLPEAELADLRLEHPGAQVLPLSPLQEGLLFHSVFDRNEVDDYTMQLVVDLVGEVAPSLLRQCVQGLFDRHLNLRAAFVHEGTSRPVQVVAGDVDVPWREVDLATGDHDTGSAEHACDALIAEERSRRFDVAQAPLARVVLVRLADARYRLVLTHHHLLLDGWSHALLLEELLSSYRRDGHAPRDTPAADYRDFLAWLSDRGTEDARRAWAELLDGVSEPTRCADPPLPAAAREERVIRFEAPAACGAALVERARDVGTTTTGLLQLAWGCVLGEQTGRDDVVFGLTTSGRPPELDGARTMIGTLIDTVPSRVRLDPARSVRATLEHLHRDTARAVDHPHLGMAEIQRQAGVGELFDSVVVVENFPLSPDVLRDAAGPDGPLLDRVTAHSGTHYPVTLIALPGAGMRFELRYRTERVGPERAAAMTEQLLRVLDELTGDPDRPLGRIDPLHPCERAALIEPAAGNGPTHAAPASLTDVFAEQVRRRPYDLALTEGSTVLDYATLQARANRLARHLRRAGARDRVALALPRCADLVVSVLAVLKAGAAYVPIDPGYPAERIADTLSDARPSLLLTTSETAGRLPDGDVPRILLDDPPTRAALEAEPDGPLTGDELPGAVHPDSAAYVIYTSGSTGRPKGVVVTHRNVLRLFSETEHWFGFDSSDVWTLFHSYAFDFSVWELWGALLYGGRLVVVDHETSRSPGEFLQLLRRERVTVLNQTPSAFGQLARADAQDPRAGRDLALRYVIFGGEALEPAKLAEWYRNHPPHSPLLVNMYGITETTVHVTEIELTDPADTDPGASPIGRPIPDLRAYVLDAALRPARSGELYVGGAGLARGYHDRPALTASRFVADPFCGSGTRMYRSGDLVRWVDGHGLDYQGRADQQVKIRGFRIEPGEVDAALLDHPDVAQAATVGRADGPGERRLVSYVVGAPDQVGSEVRDWLSHRLPAQLVPAAVVRLQELPLTPNGKLDRAALPAPDFASAVTDRRPSSAIEEAICAAFAEVLGLQRVGADDEFFELGGDSILSMQAVAAARRRGVGITPRDVFERRTAAGVAVVAAVGTGAGQADDSGGGTGRVRSTPVIAWLHRHGGEIDAHAQALAVHVPAELTEEHLTAAVQAVLDHHDVLRARLHGPGHGLDLHVDEPGSVAASDVVSRVDARGLSGARLDETLAAHAAHARARLDPAAGDVVQVAWLDRGDERGMLLLVIHHLVVDGVSWRILLPDLADAWRAIAEGREPQPAPVGTSFRRWSRLLHEEAADRAHELPYWLDVASGHDPPIGHRPLDPGRDTEASAGRVELGLPTGTTQQLLTTAPAAFHAGVEEILLAAFARAAGRWRGRRGEVLLDLEGHGRSDDLRPGVDLSRTVGWFTSIHPVRLRAGSEDRADDVKNIKEQLRAVPGDGLGHGLLRYLDPAGAAALADIADPQIGFNYLGRIGRDDGDWVPLPATAGAGAEASALPLAHVVQLDATTYDDASGPHLVARWTWAAELLDVESVRELAEDWFAELTAITEHAATIRTSGFTPSDVALSLLDQDDIARLEAELEES